MKILIAAFAAIVMALTTGYAAAGGLAELAWNKSSIGQLRKLDKAGITKLLGDLWTDAHPISVPQERDIGAFA